MTTLNWLHFTDLHQGMKDQEWLWPNVRDDLFDDLSRVSERAGPWDLVLFTGDLTQKGSPAEFSRLEETLGEIWAHLATLDSKPFLLAVPGNHDLVRPDADDPTVVALGEWHNKPSVREAFWAHEKYVGLIREAFAPYQSFWDRVAQRPPHGVVAGHLPGDFAYVHEKDGLRVGFLGLNSAFLQLTNGDFQRRLVVHPRQAQPAVSGDIARWAAKCHTAFLMTHHPPSWLSDDARARLDADIYPPGRFAGHLFGHMHESYAGTLAEGGDAPRRLWQGTSLCGLEWFGDKVDRRHGYAAGRLEVDGRSASLRVWPRRAEKGHSRAHQFGPDTSFRLQNDVGHVHEPQAILLRGEVRQTAAALSASPPKSNHPERAAKDPWSASALGTRLWDKVSPSPDAETWRTAVELTVNACHTEWERARGTHDEPWRDENLPSRTIRSLELLLVDNDIGLHASEVSLAVIAPFLREAVDAAGVAWLSEANPLSLAVEGASTGARAVLEREYEARAPLVRRGLRLSAEAREEEHRGVAFWMVHQCVLRDPSLWEHPPLGHLPMSLHDAADAARRLGPAIDSTFEWRRLRELARCVFADPERIDRDDHNDRLRDEDIVDDSLVVRERLIGYVLCLASWMAMDGRRLHDVVVGHIGLSDPLTPRDVIQALNCARWNASRETLSLTINCQHPAIDLALRDGVARAAAVLDRIRRGAANRRNRLDILNKLPVRLDADGVRPTSDADGREAYQPRHIRFELAHEEVKELLMGRQLYGEPNLAIRELYQNALDACRHREARQLYLGRIGTARLPPWQGEIHFRQAEDRGRPYLECEDNGVGMGLAELESCFAKAGRRFHDTAEFLEEQAQWLRIQPAIRLYPNSQFGIGVFSYFMLADEIEIETCRFNRDGSFGPVVHAHVASSGGLFRVRMGTRGSRSGTRVRLYLERSRKGRKADPTSSVSCVETLKRVLHVADYHTSATESERHADWKAGELRVESTKFVLPLGEDVWATDSAGILLADGIQTGGELPHLIINLRGPRRPRLTVDRKTATKWDQTWVFETLRKSWPELAAWSRLPLEMLWWLESEVPKVAINIARRRESDVIAEEVRERVSLKKVGCFALDRQILSWAVDDGWNEVEKADELDDLVSDELGFASRDFALMIVNQRVHVWDALGAQVHDEAGEMISAALEAQDVSAKEIAQAKKTKCVPEAGDWFAMSTTQGVPAGLIACALRIGERLEQVLDRFAKYEHMGFSFDGIDRSSAASLNATAADVTFLSRDLDGGSPWISGRVEALHALKAMTVLDLSAEDVLTHYKRYHCLGIRGPRLSSTQLTSTLPSNDAEWLLTTGNTGANVLGILPEISLQALVQRTSRTGMPLALALNKLRGLGIDTPTFEFEPAVDYVPTEVDFLDLGLRTASRVAVPPGAFLSTLAASGSPELAERRLDVARRAGVIPASCTNDVFAGMGVDKVDMQLLSRDLDGASPWLSRWILRTHVRRAANQLRMSVEDVEQRLQRLSPLGVEIVEVNESNDRE